MMKFFLIALSLTAVLAQDAEDMSIDSFLEESADAELPCSIKPCFPVCTPKTLYISYGSFKIPYQKNVCAPLTSCLNANKACQALLIKTIQQAQAQEKLVKSSYSAAKMAHANHVKKAAAAKAATEEAAKAAKAMEAAKSWSAAKTAQYGAAVREYNQAKATMDAKKTTMDAAVKQYQNTKTDHLDAVAAMHRANSAAAKALADFKAKAKAHCDSEALHARIVHSLGHAQLATKDCQKYSSSLIAGKYSVSYTNGFRTTYTITSDGKVSGTGLPNAGARTLVPSTSSKCPGQPCFFLTGVHSRGKDEYIIQKSDGTLKIEHYNPGHCCTGTGRPLKGEEEEVASSEIEAENAASPEVDDVEEEQSLSRWPYVVRSGRDCIGGAFKCGHGSLHTAYRACEASRHCGAVAFRGNHFCLKHPVRHCRQDYRNGYKMYKKPHCPNYRMMAPRRVDCKHGAYKCGASYSECDAKRKCAGDRRCGGVSVSPNGKHYCLKHKKRHCSKDYGNKYTFFTK